MKVLCDKYFKALKKEIKDLRRWKALPCSFISRIIIANMFFSLKAMYRLNIIPTGWKDASRVERDSNSYRAYSIDLSMKHMATLNSATLVK